MGVKNYIEGNPKSNLFIFKDLANPRLTWRLYDQKDNKLILSGFYSQDAAFEISHTYSNGLGNDAETVGRSQLRNMLRGLARSSKDIYKSDRIKGYINSAKNAASLMLSKMSREEGGLLDRASSSLDNFNLDEEWDRMLRASKVVTQGDKSKLYDSTDIKIPTISTLKCTIWSLPDTSCREVIKDIYNKYFIGNFVKLENEGGGYWEAPNSINLGEDDPLSDKIVSGSFALRVGPYLFKNLLLNSFKWEYSKEMISYPSSNGEIPTSQTEPAYAECTIDLENYKYKTKDYLESIYVPSQIKDSGSQSLEYNRNS